MAHKLPSVTEMDLSEDIRRAIEGLEWEELNIMLEGVISDLCGEPPSPSPRPSLPAEQPASPQPAADSATEDLLLKELNSVLEGVISDLCGEPPSPSPPPSLPAWPPASPQPAAVPQMTAPPATVPAHLYSEPVTGSQGQNFLYHWPVSSIPTAATAPPAAPANPCFQSNTILQIPDSMVQNLCPVGVMNGVLVYDLTKSSPALDTPTPKKRKRQDEQEELHIKKPPNAFMLFLMEQRPKVKAAMKSSGSAAVNAVVGERWKSLSWDQQAKYYQQADEERRLHAQKYPAWSAKDNYGKNRRRSRSSTCSTASASKPGASQPQRQASFFGATAEDPLWVL